MKQIFFIRKKNNLQRRRQIKINSSSKLIIQSGINTVVFRDKYKDTSGIDFLATYGIDTVHLEDNN